MASKYTYTGYSLDWPAEFQREAERLRAFPGDELVRVHHIGSTSVPGLAAKPIIDLIPVVRNIRRMDEWAATLQKKGYVAWGDYGLPGRCLFTKDHGEYRTHNLHVYQDGHSEIERHAAFCAYLREHAAIRAEYAALKLEVFRRHPADIQADNDAKDPWIKRIECQAIEWHRRAEHRSAE